MRFSNSLAAKGKATYMNIFFFHRSEIKGNATPEKGERIEGGKEDSLFHQYDRKLEIKMKC